MAKDKNRYYAVLVRSADSNDSLCVLGEGMTRASALELARARTHCVRKWRERTDIVFIARMETVHA
jgi:predicted RNA-binding protein with PIN domain